MKKGMTLEELLTEVSRQTRAKRDFVTSTQDNVRMVEANDVSHGVAIVLLKQGESELERFEVSEHAHRQISAKLGIPWKYYFRLLTDHRDLVIDQVNALFEREPSSRLFRCLDNRLRAFLSDRYLRIDNSEVLTKTLPAIVKGDIQTKLLSSNVHENSMHLKVLFTDDRLAQEITSRTRSGESRVVRPGFRLSNSETGMGTLKIEGFFWDSYCDNGCVFGAIEAFQFRRTHLGGRLIEGVNFEVMSDRSRRLEDDTIVSQVSDVMTAMANPEFAHAMGEKLREAANTPDVRYATAAVDLAAIEHGLTEHEQAAVLETFIRDTDYSQWGMASAITAVANRDDVTYDRANELEDIGAKVLSMQLRDWQRYVVAEKAKA